MCCFFVVIDGEWSIYVFILGSGVCMGYVNIFNYSEYYYVGVSVI